jgi:hypothetical protein
LLTKSIFDYLLLQIVFMVKMNGVFMQTLLKNTGLQLITKFIVWYIILIIGMSILKVGIPPVWIQQMLGNILGNKLYIFVYLSVYINLKQCSYNIIYLRSQLILKNENIGFWCHTLLHNITSDLRYRPAGKIVVV